MTRKTGGLKRKSRYTLKKESNRKGKISVSRFMQSFKAGERVTLLLEPSIHKGLYHHRFFGKTGVIMGPRGKCYEVAIKDGNKEKMIIVHPVHLKITRD
jgi:large subunit ribosomal protein L21e